MKNLFNTYINSFIILAVVTLLSMIPEVQASAADISAASTTLTMAAVGGTMYIGQNQYWLDRFVQFLASPKSNKYLASKYAGGVTNPLITEATLRMEAKLDGEMSQIKFYTNERNNSRARSSEKLLDETSTFWPQYVSLGLQKENIEPAGNSHNGGNTCIEQRSLFTYPDPAYFSEDKEYRELQMLWNSCLSLKTGKTIRMEDWDLSKTLYVPGCCQYLPADKSESGFPRFPAYGPTMEERGFAPINIPLPIFGGMDNEFCIELPKGTTSAIVGGKDECGIDSCNVAVLRLCGYQFNGTTDDLCLLSRNFS